MLNIGTKNVGNNQGLFFVYIWKILPNVTWKFWMYKKLVVSDEIFMFSVQGNCCKKLGYRLLFRNVLKAVVGRNLIIRYTCKYIFAIWQSLGSWVKGFVILVTVGFDYCPLVELVIRCKKRKGWSASWILSDFLLKIEVERHCCTSCLAQVLKPKRQLGCRVCDKFIKVV